MIHVPFVILSFGLNGLSSTKTNISLPRFAPICKVDVPRGVVNRRLVTQEYNECIAERELFRLFSQLPCRL